MELLFVHPNFPGQFRRISQAFASKPGFRVFGVGDRSWMKAPIGTSEVPVIAYPPPDSTPKDIHPHASSFEQAVRRGHQVIATLAQYKREGLEPDAIFVHPGWGDGFFLRHLFPGARVLGLFEYFYNPRGADVGFDPEFPSRIDDIFRLHALNATQLLALESCDQGFCPTDWQRRLFPQTWRDRLAQVHEGVDTALVAPNQKAEVTLPDGTHLRAGDEVLTFVSRNLEPYRGYHTFMRALPSILRQRPQCRVVIVGDDGAGYGAAPKDCASWRERYLLEVRADLDMSRVHFTGPLPYGEYLKVLQVSRAHAYLTYPFILSWSMLEAMSAGCLVLGSDTGPVQEVIHHGENGLLFPFNHPGRLAETAVEALSHPDSFAQLRQRARLTAIERYDLRRVALPAYEQLLTS